MKPRSFLLAGTVATATLLSAVVPGPRILVWNATASVPTGLYHVRGITGLHVGERVVIDPPPRLRAYLADRGYLPSGVPLLKDIAALPGDTVCRSGLVITINGERAGLARPHDSRARPLPAWQGCRIIGADEIFVMNRRAVGSFDGRYLGPISRADVIGRASPVWTDETGDGEHVWFARPQMTQTTHDDKETKP